MVDMSSYLAEKKQSASWIFRGLYAHSGNVLDKSDLRSPMSDCQCRNCKKIPKEPKFRSVFEAYHAISLIGLPKRRLSLHAYLLCPKSILAFAFRTRRWGTSSVLLFSQTGETADLGLQSTSIYETVRIQNLIRT